VNSLRNAEAYTAPMFKLLENLPEKKEKVTTDLVMSNYNLQKIIVENLSFEFSNDYQVLNNISFEVLRNQTLAIMGDSGSGKSTLVDLILGLYVPTQGKISYLSDNKSEMSHKNFTISYISQNCSLFGSDLYENISLRKNLSEVERDTIDQISKSLHLDNFFIDNNIREIRSDNTNVSGGERQRISIARAKFFDTEIVVLDEPTSALDKDNKKRVFKYLQEISHNKTVIIVTHSRDLLDIADLVLLLEKGRKIFYGPTLEFKAFENRNI
jgi:ABC-type bacteriocin/lantibiotic exporter with double-glycine peptidase domain